MTKAEPRSSTGASEDKVKRNLRRKLGLDPDSGIPIESHGGGPNDLVKQYVGGGYTGAAFDTYGRNDPIAITPDDLIAVTMLSIQVNENSTSAIRPSAILDLQARAGDIEMLLTRLPSNRDLHTLTQEEFDTWLGSDSPGEALYKLMRQQISLPRVATHKLLARKRPLLLPIRDTVVEQALDLSGRDDDWWRPWWGALSTDDALVQRLAGIREQAGTPYLSLLRVADIVIWLGTK
ncbi:DUF6308 family protein [Mycobacterium kubicae]|uniref:DUF6308 family protein n=1 Tax=Mycobacterium kubicae TaxID=120959 RepID=UPI0007FE691D|nr:DUF6308 family protein [Mycobacterium kubicae]OBK45600.1 hypothetical protein A5657_03010 [Mycobacterium kubicae]